MQTSNGARLLILTGIFPPDIGGPAKYIKNLSDEFIRRGYQVKILVYKTERNLPLFFGHFFYFLRIILTLPKTNFIIAFDTLSVGLPGVIAAKIFKKKIFVRASGDFLWESYVERSGNLLTLSQFYQTPPPLSRKEKIIFRLTRFVLKHSSAIVFTTKWLIDIWKKAYIFNQKQIFIIENYYGPKASDSGFKEKNFLWAGRPLKLKNLEMLKAVFSAAKKRNDSIKLEISGKISQSELMKKIQSCYAVILPSLSDVSPNLILEAAQANKPFIMTRETGLFDRLKEVGVFINPLDQGDIEEKVLFLANEDNYREYKNKIKNFDFTHAWQEIANEFLVIDKNL